MSEIQTGPCADACIYSDGGDNQPEVCGTLIVKARKSQTCCECREAITPGTHYEIVSGKWEGEWLSFKTCLPCKEIREAFCCEGWVYGSLWEDAQTFLEEFTTGCLEKLTTAAAKEKVTEQWRQMKELVSRR